MGSDITDNDIRSRHDFMSKNSQIVDQIMGNVSRWKEKAVPKNLLKSSNQELKYLEADIHDNN